MLYVVLYSGLKKNKQFSHPCKEVALLVNVSACGSRFKWCVLPLLQTKWCNISFWLCTSFVTFFLVLPDSRACLPSRTWWLNSWSASLPVDGHVAASSPNHCLCESPRWFENTIGLYLCERLILDGMQYHVFSKSWHYRKGSSTPCPPTLPILTHFPRGSFLGPFSVWGTF